MSPDLEISRPFPPDMQAVSDSMAELMGAEAMAAVFAPTPLDLLGIAALHRIDPEYALELAGANAKAHWEAVNADRK